MGSSHKEVTQGTLLDERMAETRSMAGENGLQNAYGARPSPWVPSNGEDQRGATLIEEGALAGKGGRH